MKTPEKIIIEKVGEFWWICGKHKPEFLKAMQEYSDQQLTDYKELIKLQDEYIKWIYEYSTGARFSDTEQAMLDKINSLKSKIK